MIDGLSMIPMKQRNLSMSLCPANEAAWANAGGVDGVSASSSRNLLFPNHFSHSTK